MTAGDGDAPIEHAWSWEVDVRSEHVHGVTMRYEVRRLVCACSWSSRWRRDAYLAQREAARVHGTRSQLSLL